MSWFSTHYEKALLGGAVLTSLGAIYFGWSSLKAVDQDFGASLKGNGANDASVKDSQAIAQALQSMKLDRSWKQGEGDNGRSLDLFVGIPLFLQRSNPTKGLDLFSGPDVHAGIPNSFWLDYDLDPGYADSPQRDPDEDGFTNLEEFQAQTDPTDFKSHPPLITKLRYLKDESVAWILKPGFTNAQQQVAFDYRDGKGQTNKVDALNPIGQGALFFEQGPAAKRFKLLALIKGQGDDFILKIEDQSPNKKGTIYELPSPLLSSKQNQFIQHDRSAIMTLEALKLGGQSFKIEENTRFSLPHDAPTKDYLLKSVTPESIVVEAPGPDGKPMEVTISKPR